MKFKIIVMSMFAAALVSCGTTSTVPITGRKHNLLVSDEQVLSLSNQEYTKYMQTAKASTNATNTAMVKRVGQRLANAVETYLRNNGMSSEINNFKWEFNLVQDKSVNAFCMPGGKIVVYEGLLPVTQNEASLAVVLGHEIAHAVAKHSAEQMSKQMRQQYGTQIGSGVLSALGVGSDVTSMASSVAGQLFSFKNLKYSRDNESEADHMGLIFAAMAGYDPNVAVSFWKRMAAQGSSSSSDLFSDHPSDSKRIAAIQNEMPEALKYYQASGSSSNGTTQSVSKTKGTSRRR
jgi:predicted Zn-dependent protease